MASQRFTVGETLACDANSPTSREQKDQDSPERTLHHHDATQDSDSQGNITYLHSKSSNMSSNTAVTKVDLSQYNIKKIASGKVREIFEIDDQTLLFVATDRISAYDVILNNVSLSIQSAYQCFMCCCECAIYCSTLTISSMDFVTTINTRHIKDQSTKHYANIC